MHMKIIMKKQITEKYQFIELNNKQYIFGWILFPMYLWFFKHMLCKPLLNLFFSNTYINDSLSGPIACILVLAGMLYIFKYNIRLSLENFFQAKITENFKWIIKSIVFYFSLKLASGLVLSVLRLLLCDKYNFDGPINENVLDQLAEGFPYFYVFFAILIAPILEELMFRYLIYHSLRRLNKYIAVIGSSLIFSLVHVLRELINGQIVETMFYGMIYMSIAISLAVVYEKRRNIVFCVILHIFNNLLAFI